MALAAERGVDAGAAGVGDHERLARPAGMGLLRQLPAQGVHHGETVRDQLVAALAREPRFSEPWLRALALELRR